MCEQKDGDRPLASDHAGFVAVGSTAQLPTGSTMRVTVGEVDLTLVNTGARIVAIGDLCLRCSHSLSIAPYMDGVLTCEACGWKYDVQRGWVEGLPNLRLEMHDVRVEDGRLLVASAIAVPVTVP